MRMITHGRQTIVTETIKQPTFGPVSFIICFYIEKESHSLVQCFSAGKFFSGRLKKPTIYPPCRLFLLDNGFIVISKLCHQYNFLL